MSLPDTSVKYFSSGMAGAPALSGTAGTLIAVLDACLVNGFGSVTLDSLSVTDSEATATCSTGHGFAMAGNTGPVIEVGGATPTGLNGVWRVASVPTSTTFTFAVEGVSNGTATGAITAKRAPAGWEKRYSGTNKAVYARAALEATAMLLRVDDTPAQWPTLLMYESMTDVDTGVGASPTQYTYKSNAATTAERSWRVIADPLAFYWFILVDNTAWNGMGLFGDILSFKPGDAFHCCLSGHSGTSSLNYRLSYFNAVAGYFCRGYTQTGGVVDLKAYASALQQNRFGYGGMAGYPNPVDNALHLSTVVLLDPSNIRGSYPGIYSPLHDGQPADWTLVDDIIIGGKPRTLFAQAMTSTTNKCVAMLDITGPWR